MGKRVDDEEGIRQRLEELRDSGRLEDLKMEADKIEGLLISPDNLTLAIEGLEELEKKINARVNAHIDELSPYLHKKKIWAKQGFDVTGLGEVLRQEHKDMDNVERLFWRFEKMVERVVNMEKDLFSISTPEFEVEIEGLRDIMTDPRRIGEVARKYHHLVERINALKRDTTRRKELADTVEKFKDMGYKVDSMVPSFDADLKTLEVSVSELEDAVIILQDLEAIVGSLDQTGQEERIELVKKLLYDPSRITEAIDEVEALERTN